jgi:predicted SAM-dependent methyltransferase
MVYSQIYPISNPQSRLDNLASRLSVSLGKCPICENFTIFSNFTDNLRESGQCLICKSSNRQRQIAVTLLKVIHETKGIKFSSIHKFALKLPTASFLSDLKIYNAETTGSTHNLLAKYQDNYYASEYLGDDYQSGEIVNGILNQNLLKTSFETSSLDIVISSDVFEHIPDPYKGFAEIHRILKPGGRHIFTVPFYGDRYRDEIRTVIESDGSVNHLLPPSYHDDPIRPEGILVYVIFSMEMLMKLNDMGYQVKMYNMRNPCQGIFGNNAIIFEAIKCNSIDQSINR